MGGPGGVGEMRQEGAPSEQFGELPPALRDKVRQAEREGFPSGYSELLEGYYRALAEEQDVVPESGPTADPPR